MGPRVRSTPPGQGKNGQRPGGGKVSDSLAIETETQDPDAISKKVETEN